MKTVFIAEGVFVDGEFIGAGSKIHVPDTLAVILVETGRARLTSDGDPIHAPAAETATAAPAPERAVATPSKRRR